MKKPSVKSRKDAVNLIDANGKRQEFIDGWGRTPEQYFDEYSYQEPQIWGWVLNDLDIAFTSKEKNA